MGRFQDARSVPLAARTHPESGVTDTHTNVPSLLGHVGIALGD